MKHPIEVGGQHLRTTLGTQLIAQCFRQRRKSRDIREYGAAANPVGDFRAGGQRVAAVPGDIGFRIIGAGGLDDRRLVFC